jgi:hypothetical protein
MSLILKNYSICQTVIAAVSVCLCGNVYVVLLGPLSPKCHSRLSQSECNGTCAAHWDNQLACGAHPTQFAQCSNVYATCSVYVQHAHQCLRRTHICLYTACTLVFALNAHWWLQGVPMIALDAEFALVVCVRSMLSLQPVCACAARTWRALAHHDLRSNLDPNMGR